MSQRSSESDQEASTRPTPANAIGEERILDAAYELLLAIGMRRMTMADIARHAEVSRATLYRRWPNVQAVVAALMTREWTIALVSAFQPDAVDGRARLVEEGLRQGQADGSIRDGDPVWLARQIILVSLASAVSGPVMAEKDEYPKLDEELRVMLTRYLTP